MTSNDWLMQFLADIINITVDRPVIQETTALGAAMLVLLQSDRSFSLQDIADRRKSDAEFKPKMSASLRQELLDGWNLAIKRTLTGC